MTYRLRSYDQIPTGGYPYNQPEPKPFHFKSEPLIEEQAKIVLSYRRGNRLARATFRECLEDIDHFTCSRLNGNPTFCVTVEDGSNAIALTDNAPGLNPCKGCGVKLS